MYRVLLIDDQPIFRDIIRAMLDKAGGFEVVAEREDGVQAANSYQEILPDAVIMDVQMPQMNGFEASGAILGVDPKAVIVLTS
ncbi:MAG: response regulator transcription factor, partial [Dehalococcoidia bacterium]|nr:response regulator transcription factor [Dehalococcoidia bacterium]